MVDIFFIVFGPILFLGLSMHLFFDIKKSIWKNKCNEKTYLQRKEIMPKPTELPHELFSKKMKLFDKVSYREHYQALVNNEDPYELYDKELFESFQKFEVYKETNKFGTVVFYYYNKNNIRIVHNEDGPAIIEPSGHKEWIIHDKNVNDEVNEWFQERNIHLDDMTEEDKFAFTFFMRSH